MAIIEERIQGACKIIVHDDYIRGPEEVKKIVDNVSRIIWNDLRGRELKKRQKEREEINI